MRLTFCCSGIAGLPVRQGALDDNAAAQGFSFAPFGRQVHLCGLIGDGGPVEVRGEPGARRHSALGGGGGIVECATDRVGDTRHIAWRKGQSGLAVDDGFAKATNC